MSDPAANPVVAPGPCLELLSEPCAFVDRAGVVQYVNSAWREGLGADAVGAELPGACVTLFRWDPAVWNELAAELAALCDGQTRRVQFAARLAAPPERWYAASLAPAAGTGGLIWQLSEVTRWVQAEAGALRRWRQLRDAVESISDGFALYDADDRLVFCNQRYKEIYAESADLMVPGRSFEEILTIGAQRGQYPAAVGREEEWVRDRLARHQRLETVEQQLPGGRWLRAADRRTTDGGIVGIRTDITDLKLAEQLRREREQQEQTIQAQDALLAELSTPLLRITERALVMPLIGNIDSVRAMRIVESLLQAVDAQRADLVILDITGVPIVDTQVANVLIQSARAVRLLGASLVLTGIHPDVAQTLITLGIDLSDIVTRADLQAGVRYALTHHG